MIVEDKPLFVSFSVLYLLFLFERGYFQLKAMRISGEAAKLKESKSRTAAMIFLFFLGQIWVIGSFIYIWKPNLMQWTRIPIPSWIRWLGGIITISGMTLEFSTQISLGRNYTTTLHIREEQSLVTSGPYRYVRHPMYTALFMVGVGLGLLSTSWYFLLPFIGTGIMVALRIQREENAMIAKFGDEYIQYMQRTGRFFPKISK